MDLLTILISGIGSGIAKGILNIWLADDDEMFTKEVSKNFVGILASKTKDIIAQRKGARQFEVISEEMAENLLPIFNASKNTSEERKKEIAQIIGVAINNLSVTPKILASNNFKPEKIEELLVAETVVPNEENPLMGFTSNEIELYKRIISEAAQYMVDIGSNLPKFTQQTFAEVLKRTDSITNIASKILEEVKQIKKLNESSDERYREFESNYRRAVVRKLDELTLFGVDLSQSSKRYRLSTAYVRLSAEFKNIDSKTSKGLVKKKNIPSPEDLEDLELLSINEVIHKSNRLLLRGPAGSGKTTLMQWVAVMSASSNLKRELESWNHCIPFFIRLREFSEKPLPKLEDLPALVAPALSSEMPKRWVNDKLKAQQAIILVDGVDEIAENKRTKIKEWLKDIDETYPNNKWIVTSRPYAASKEWLSEFGFLNANLQDMGIRDIEVFIEHWHSAVQETESSPEKKEELEILQKKLKTTIRENRAIRKLATSPLLCAMICALHRDRSTQLPSDRIELYRACIDMFLRRDIERSVDLVDYKSLGDRQKKVLLADFAYWLIKNSWSEVEISKVDDRFSKKLAGISKKPKELSGKGIRRYFVERSGILRQPTIQTIDFPHRTFEEYLAAKAIIDEGDIGLLANNATNDQWREVIQLACGMARKEEANEVIMKIIKIGDLNEPMKTTLHLLAVACLETTIEIDANTKYEVQSRLVKLVPPKNIEAVTELAKAGDLVLPYLSYNKKMNVKESSFCIRTLAIIGGDKALNLLSEYTKDKRKGIKKALLAGIKFSDEPRMYAKKIKLEFTEVYLGNKMPFEVLDVLPKLKIINCPISIKDLEVFSDLTNLLELHIPYSKSVTNLQALKNLDNLESLRMTIGQELDLSPLSNLKNLKNLDLEVNSLVDFTPLNNLDKLTNFKLYINNVADVNSLAKLSRLTQLNIFNAELKGNLGRLADLKRLDFFSIYEVSKEKFSQLSQLNNLQDLSIYEESVGDLNFVSSLTNLKSLEIYHLTTNDLSPLENLKKLKRLEIWHSTLTDINVLANIEKLKYLYIGNCLVKNIDSLKHLNLTIHNHRNRDEDDDREFVRISNNR